MVSSIARYGDPRNFAFGNWALLFCRSGKRVDHPAPIRKGKVGAWWGDVQEYLLVQRRAGELGANTVPAVMLLAGYVANGRATLTVLYGRGLLVCRREFADCRKAVLSGFFAGNALVATDSVGFGWLVVLDGLKAGLE